MKHLLLSSLLVAVTLLPAIQVKETETQRGKDQLMTALVSAIDKASAQNKGHVWLPTKGFNMAQAYEVQRELEKKGYTLDISPNLFFVSW